MKQETVHPVGGSNGPTFKVIRTSKQNEPVVTPLTIATPTLADLSLCLSVLFCVLTVARLTPISLAPFSPRPAKWEKPAGEEPIHTPAPGLSGKPARCVLVDPLPETQKHNSHINKLQMVHQHQYSNQTRHAVLFQLPYQNVYILYLTKAAVEI